jgi:hypothetical protein
MFGSMRVTRKLSVVALSELPQNSSAAAGGGYGDDRLALYEFETMFVMAHKKVWFSFEDVDASVVHGGACQLGRPHPGAAKAEVFL